MEREEITSEWCSKRILEIKELKEDIDKLMVKHKLLLEKIESNETVYMMGEEISGINNEYADLARDVLSQQEKSMEYLNILDQYFETGVRLLIEYKNAPMPPPFK